MKVILTEDVKGRGKVGDVIEVANGYANYLFKNNLALPANDENLQILNDKKKKEADEEEKLIAEMALLKSFIESNPVSIKVKTGAEGKIFGTVSTKQIVDEYKKQYDIKLDKKKIKTEETVNALGTYLLKIELHKQVEAIITVRIEE